MDIEGSDYLNMLAESVHRDLENARTMLQNRINVFVLIVTFMILAETALLSDVVAACRTAFENGVVALPLFLCVACVGVALVLVLASIAIVGSFYHAKHSTYLVPDRRDLPFMPEAVDGDISFPPLDAKVLACRALLPNEVDVSYRAWVYQVASALHEQLDEADRVTRRFNVCGIMCIISMLAGFAAVGLSFAI